ncbi:MAG: hypothetical protein KKB38_20160 [Gammaproteobacteria bacterium]|nr:hypothetical protein [Gammaproteobacteria bacterium]
MELTDLAANSDGSFTVNIDGKSVKLVKESDLLAVKGAAEQAKEKLEAQTSKLMTDLAEANRLKDEKHNLLLQEQAAKEQLMKDAQEAVTLKTKVGELESKLSTEGVTRKTTEEQLLGLMQDRFTNLYKVAPDKVKGMSLDQLREAEKNFTLVGLGTSRSANYDGGAGGTGGTGQRTDAQKLAERYPTMKVTA